MAFDNAEIGASTIIEPGAEIGFRYSDDCGPARIGAHGIIRRGTLIYGDVSIGDYCTVTNNSTLEGLIRLGTGVRIMSHGYVPSRTWFGDRVFVGPGTCSSTKSCRGASIVHRRHAARRSRTMC